MNSGRAEEPELAEVTQRAAGISSGVALGRIGSTVLLAETPGAGAQVQAWERTTMPLLDGAIHLSEYGLPGGLLSGAAGRTALPPFWPGTETLVGVESVVVAPHVSLAGQRARRSNLTMDTGAAAVRATVLLGEDVAVAGSVRTVEPGFEDEDGDAVGIGLSVRLGDVQLTTGREIVQRSGAEEIDRVTSWTLEYSLAEAARVRAGWQSVSDTRSRASVDVNVPVPQGALRFGLAYEGERERELEEGVSISMTTLTMAGLDLRVADNAEARGGLFAATRIRRKHRTHRQFGAAVCPQSRSGFAAGLQVYQLQFCRRRRRRPSSGERHDDDGRVQHPVLGRCRTGRGTDATTVLEAYLHAETFRPHPCVPHYHDDDARRLRAGRLAAGHAGRRGKGHLRKRAGRVTGGAGAAPGARRVRSGADGRPSHPGSEPVRVLDRGQRRRIVGGRSAQRSGVSGVSEADDGHRSDAAHRGAGAGILGGTQNLPLAERLSALVELVWPSGQINVQAVHVPAETLVRIRLDTEINSSRNSVGDRIRYRIVDDVIVDGRIVIPAGAEGEARVTGVQAARAFGQAGRVEIDWGFAHSFDGTPIRFNVSARASQENQQLAVAASVAGLMLLGPIGLVSGFLVQGQEHIIPAGTEFFVEVARSVEVLGLSLTPVRGNN